MSHVLFEQDTKGNIMDIFLLLLLLSLMAGTGVTGVMVVGLGCLQSFRFELVW